MLLSFVPGAGRAVVIAAALVVLSAVAVGEVPPGGSGVTAGERVDPASYGPGVVETMDVVIERDRVRREAEAQRGAPDEVVHGAWAVPPRRAARFPHSGTKYVTNKHGDTSMGVGFGRVVDVDGAFLATQIAPEVTTPGIVVVGYRGGAEVARTGVLRGLGAVPAFFSFDLRGVDRIVIEAETALNGAGWYALDDLTYTVRDGAGGALRRVVLDFEDTTFRQVLTGTDYAGLSWEEGTGDFARDDEVPAPMPDPNADDDEAAGDEGPVPAGGGGTLPERLLEFQGVLRGDAGSFSFPPDSNGAIGPDHFVITVNRNFAVYDKSDGSEISNVLLGSFLPGSNGDPRVLYDQYVDRWIVIASDFSATDSIFLAVSLTDDPTGAWFKASYVAGAGSDAGCWPDYPTLGLDADGYYIGANMVGCAGTIWAIEKAPLVDPAPSLGVITAFRNIALDGAIQPCHTYGDSGGELYVSRSGSTSLRVRQTVGPITSPSLVELGSVSIPSHASPPDVPALGSGTPLDHTVSHRILNAVYRNGSIWATHDISINGRSAVRWYEADATSLSTNQVGTISSATLHYFYGGIGVNSQGDVGLGFSGSNEDQYAGCYFTGRLASDPPGQTAAPVQYQAGLGPQNNIDGFGRNRWGDYSLTTVDPDDDLTFWTIQEYGHDVDIWGTFVLQMRGEVPLLSFDYPDGRPTTLPPAGGTVRVAIAGQFGGVLDPGSPTLHYDAGGGAVTAPLALVSAGLYDAVFPALPCGSVVSWHVSASTQSAETFTDPPAAPAATYGLTIADGMIAIVDDFESDAGWTPENLGATSGDWQRGVPVNDPGWDYDPVSDGDGSGQCWLTQNEVGNTDVDNGAVRLTSPALDLSAVGVAIAYEYFLRLTNDDGSDRLLVEASSNGAAGPWVVVATHTTDGGLAWRHHEITGTEIEAAGAPLTSDMRVRFTANDADTQSIVEAGVDGFAIEAIECDEGLLGDLDGDGDIDFNDLLGLLSAWGDCPDPPAECPGDLDGDGVVGFADLLLLLAGWTG